MIDPFLWEIRSLDNLDAPLGNTAMNYVDNGVNTSLIITAAGRNPAKGYKIVHIDGTPVLDTAKTANELAAGATLPILCFTNELLALNASWRYNDTGAALGATWYTGPDSNFPSSGPGIFDAKRTNGIDIPPFCRPVIVPNPLPVGTCTTLSNTTTRVFVTNQFFRTHFNFSGNPAQVLLQMETYADDGAIVYLNGSVLQNLGMPTGPLNNVSLSTRGHDPDREVFLYAPAPLLVGDNVIAAQVAQQTAGSSDITWGCRISVLQAAPPVARPRLSIVNSGANVIVSWTPALAATLKSSTSISAPVSSWTTVGTTSPQTVPRAGTQKFFILVP